MSNCLELWTPRIYNRRSQICRLLNCHILDLHNPSCTDCGPLDSCIEDTKILLLLGVGIVSDVEDCLDLDLCIHDLVFA